MVEKSDWQEMKKQAFAAFAASGSLDVPALQELVEIGSVDGGFDDHEKVVLIGMISKLTRADLSDTMWVMVDELINKFDLAHDSEASIEHLDDENDLPEL